MGLISAKGDIMNEINLTHKEMVESSNMLYNIRMSELNFTNVYAWQEKYAFHLEVINDDIFLINKAKEGLYFSQPIGSLMDLDHLEATIKMLKTSFDLNEIHFKKCSDTFKSRIEKLNFELDVTEVRDDFDYLYDFNGLKDLKGKLYHKKKNHVNLFMKNYSWSYEAIKISNKEDVILLLEDWFKEADEDLLLEKKAITRVLTDWDNLNVTGGILYVENIPVAFAIGEVIHQDTLLMHFEKANTDYQGAYAMMTHTYINQFKDLLYVNREQDLGIPGLRKSKLSYHPVDFVKKYNISVR